MKLLCVSDTVMPQLESASNLRRRYSDVELIVSCGDMPAAYLDYISSILGKPLLYVRGNHDEMYATEPPGGIDLHNNLFEYKGVSFIGLEGSIQYNGGPIQYTQNEMRMKVLQLAPRLRYNRWRRGYGVDVFVTHSPPKGIHDAEDLPHQGFDAFLDFLAWYRPRYMIHGHVHTWDRRKVVDTQYKHTRILNINPYYVLTVEPVE
ncbi:metallophosphoesterase [Aggregatilineales bacterium SYSU G02658]